MYHVIGSGIFQTVKRISDESWGQVRVRLLEKQIVSLDV